MFIMIAINVWLAISANTLCPQCSSFISESLLANLRAKPSKSSCITWAMICIVLPASLALADLRSSAYKFISENFSRYLSSQGVVKFSNALEIELTIDLRVSVDDVYVDQWDFLDLLHAFQALFPVLTFYRCFQHFWRRNLRLTAVLEDFNESLDFSLQVLVLLDFGFGDSVDIDWSVAVESCWSFHFNLNLYSLMFK